MFPLQKLRLISIALLSIFIFTSCSSSNEDILIDEPQSINNEIVVNIESTSFEDAIRLAINTYRVSIGKSSLEKLDVIKVPALDHTNYMIQNDQISHDNFNERANYLIENANAVVVSENLAFGFNDIQELITAWIDSSGHRENIEGDFTHFDVIARQNAEGKWFYTNIFIKR